MRGASEDRTEPYRAYGEGGPELATKQTAILRKRTLIHFDVDRHARGERKIGQCFDDLRGRIKYFDETLVDAHLKLFSRIFVDERRAVHRILFDLCRERHRTYYLRVIAKRGVDDLAHRGIEHLVLVRADADA